MLQSGCTRTYRNRADTVVVNVVGKQQEADRLISTLIKQQMEAFQRIRYAIEHVDLSDRCFAWWYR